ncbi:uncharacterized protein LOC121899389 isoform X2 [Thunnus maccoyii]|uniref:uncharacterized protein LOC121899389 isoform X2 n=1 Tax=Thunnus maccoyii TaxID=8240 RepID=UPI001C4C79EA|nr:uncharacterized protein LOC121899389 isoform X2 [Thunnus maccoyii]
MAHLIYLPLLLATIQLPLVSGTGDQWPLGGVNSTLSKECGEGPDKWIATLHCRAGRWIFQFKCCEPLKKSVKVMVLPQGKQVPNNWNKTGFEKNLLYESNTFDINLRDVKGCVKPCHSDSEVCLGGPEQGESAKHCCKHFNAKDECINLHGGTIHFSVPSIHNRTVNIQFKRNNTEINTTQHSITCKSTDGNSTGLRFYESAKTWIGALKHCHGQNSSLVQITNETVQEDVKLLLEENCGNINLQRGVWIGLERSIFGCNVPWMWTSGTEVENGEWNSSFPIDPVNNHCGKIIWVNESITYKWQDAHCFDELPFICQVTT